MDENAYRKIWCGEGDLNPHEIAPASTSSHEEKSPPVPSRFLSAHCSHHFLPPNSPDSPRDHKATAGTPLEPIVRHVLKW